MALETARGREGCERRRRRMSSQLAVQEFVIVRAVVEGCSARREIGEHAIPCCGRMCGARREVGDADGEVVVTADLPGEAREGVALEYECRDSGTRVPPRMHSWPVGDPGAARIEMAAVGEDPCIR